VGRLAGGVAHDFNNLLTPILGYAALLSLDMPETHPQHKPLYYIKHAAERARDLTAQLLAFSRRQVLELKTVPLSSIVKAFEPILLRTIREDVKLIWRLSAQGQVRADVGQIEQVLMNLAVNAQDAMPKGGALTIETEDWVLDEAYARQHPEINPGPYLMLAVSDTGTGIDPKLLEHLFEPFFTTKVLGKGTGLGLSMVYGIVKQHGGSLSVYSEAGHGSTFKVFLPRVADETPAEEVRAGAASAGTLERGYETILVVEDNSLVRDLACDMLRTLGYRVLSAESAEQSLQLSETEAGNIDLLLADVIIPGMDGKEIYDRLSVRRPGLKVLYMSGYTSNVIVHHGILDQGVDFIPKPLSLPTLSKKLRKILDAPAK
jgi:CheY-like chemotaxis protein